MMNRLIYVELKTGFAGNGPAWIGVAGSSKSGTTIYFDGKALKRARGGGKIGNHFDIETGEEYWVSGLKKNEQDRHWAGGGKISIDRTAVSDYLALTGLSTLPSNLHPADLASSEQLPHHNDLENRPLD